MFINMLKKVSNYIEKKQNSMFLFPVDKQKSFIYRFSEPKDLIERAYFQYLCQYELYGHVLGFFITISSLPFFLILFIRSIFNGNIAHNEYKDLVFFRDGKPDSILPEILKKEFKFIENNPAKGYYLDSDGKHLLKKIIKRYPFAWLFILKIFIKITKYGYVINCYKPISIVVCCEYSFTSSVLTEYCRMKKIKHINVMHGEKLYFMMDSFFCFDRCYVWDRFYIDLFISLRATENQFIIAVPPSLSFRVKNTYRKIYDYTYYLGGERHSVLVNISNNLEELKRLGYRVCVRPHPRYSDIQEIELIFRNIEVEDYSLVAIEKSIMQTGCVISLYSTVLNQALYNNVPIAIDDISNKDNYLKLKTLKYIILNKKHLLLSEIILKKE